MWGIKKVGNKRFETNTVLALGKQFGTYINMVGNDIARSENNTYYI